MVFNPLLVSALIVNPLRYFFANYASKVELQWDPDPKKSQIEIGTVNDFNTIPLEQKPRVLIDRGNYQIQKTGLTDNMMSAPGVKESLGLMHRTNMVFIQGMMVVNVEANNEGTCELITDMVSNFIVWSRPILCDSQGFKEFGLPMQVSQPQVVQEAKEKFSVQISFPYIKEENWTVNQDAIKIKNIFQTVSAEFPKNS